MEKAYDSVWREGLLVKLHRMGIQGKTWIWIQNFLQNRQAFTTLHGWEGEKFNTNVGLPQGSVISPLLFNLFVQDIFKDVTGDKIKFADDGSVWHIGDDLATLTESLESDLSAVMSWARKWRMKINTEKTEVCLFRNRPSTSNTRPIVKMGNSIIPYNPTPRLLGVFLDEELNFDRHIDMVEARGNKALSLLRIVKGTEKINTKRLLQVYKAIVIPHLEYAAPVWQAARGCHRLDSIQRKGLALCAGGMVTGSREALEVELGVLPLALRREELAIREVGKILAKDHIEPIRREWAKWQEDEGYERVISPFGLAQIQIGDMSTETKTTLYNVEPCFSFVTSLQPSRSAPDYWSALGSSKSRSRQQEEQSRETVRNIIESCPAGTVLAFTDGSCQPNPGPCGAGSCIILPDTDQPIELSRPVSNHGSILLGELVAVLMTLEFIFNEVSRDRMEQIQVLSDSQSVVGLLTLGWKPNQLHTTIESTKNIIKRLERDGVTVSIDWTPGHADIAGNEIADRLAKEGSTAASDMERSEGITTQGIIKSSARESVLVKWQRQWDVSDAGRRMYSFKPSVRESTLLDHPSRLLYSKISRLRSGYVGLKKYLHQIGVSDSPLCEVCGVEETVSHYLLQCSKFEAARDKLCLNIFRVSGVGILTEELFLSVAGKDDLKEHDLDITELLGEYIADTSHI